MRLKGDTHQSMDTKIGDCRATTTSVTHQLLLGGLHER